MVDRLGVQEVMLASSDQFCVALMSVLFAIIFWGLEFTQSNATKTYALEEECGQEVSLIFDTVYQGRLVFEPRPSTPGSCVMTIETWYSMPHLMFYFANMNVSCSNGHLQFEDGRGAGKSIEGLSNSVCGARPTDLPPGIYKTKSQYLRVTYTTLAQVEQPDALTIIFTAYAIDTPCRNDQYQCSNDRCIHEGLKCNDHNSCGDNSHCMHKLSSVTTAGIVAASLVGFGILAAIVTMAVYHLYCKKKLQSQRSNTGMLYNNNNNNRSIGHINNANPHHGQTTMSIVSGQQPMYPRHWSYTDHHGNFNNNTRAPVNVNTNFHYWFVADGNRTGSFNDVRNTSRDVNVTSDNNAVSNRTLDTTPMGHANGCGDIGGTNKPCVSEDSDEMIFFEDEILMEEDLDQFDNTRADDLTFDSNVNAVNSEPKEIHTETNTTSKHTLDRSHLEKEDANGRASNISEHFTCNDLSITDDLKGYSNLHKRYTKSDDDDEIDQTFEHFYRDLIPDGYYDDMLQLDDSAAAARDTSGTGLEYVPISGNSIGDSQRYSTDL